MSTTRLPRSAARVVDDAVRRAFSDGAALSRSDLVDRTGLSRAALQNAVARMLDGGELVITRGVEPQGSGRPAQRFRLATGTRRSVLVDLLPDGSTLVVPTDLADDATAVSVASWRSEFDTWVDSVAAAVGDLGAGSDGGDAVVVAVPYPFVPGRGVSLHPTVAPIRPKGSRAAVPDWLRSDPTDALAGVLGRPVRVVNDADLAGLAEVHRGAAREGRTAIVLAVRDGFGASVVVDGRASVGAHGMSGELAHVTAVPDGPLCWCGNRGCIATQTVSPSLVEALTVRYGHDVSFDDMEDLVTHGDPVATRFLTDLGRLVGGPLATIVSFLDPDVVVVDGRLGGAGVPVAAGITEMLGQRCSPIVAAGVRIVPGRFDRPRLVGAAVVGEALAADRIADVLREPTTPPPPERAEEASVVVG
ncbi:ROK family protein [Jatrophihabitans sp. YIM 134969]